MGRKVFFAAAVGLAAVMVMGVEWPAWPGSPDESAAPAASDEPPRAGSGKSEATESPAPAVELTPTSTVAVRPAAVMPRPTAAPETAALTATAPREIRVGDQTELVVSLGANTDVGEVAFTVRFDGSVLQVRNGAEGDWATVTGAKARFEANVSGAEDQIQVRSAVTSPRRTSPFTSIALVQFQAISEGSTSVMISDVTVKNRAGHAMLFQLSPSTLQVTAGSTVPSS